MRVSPNFTWEYRKGKNFPLPGVSACLAVDLSATGILTAYYLKSGTTTALKTSGSTRKPHAVAPIKSITALQQLHKANNTWLVIQHPDERQLKSLLESVWMPANVFLFEQTLGMINRSGGVPGNPVQLVAGSPIDLPDDGFTYEHTRLSGGVAAGEPCIVVERKPGNYLEATYLDTNGLVRWCTRGVVGQVHKQSPATQVEVKTRWAYLERPALLIRNADEAALTERMQHFWKREHAFDVLMLTPDPATGVMPSIGPVRFKRGDASTVEFDPFDL